MPSAVPDRIAWALDMLHVQPDDRILEIGCGHGVALDLVSRQLEGGCIVGIDRSARAIAAAAGRNAAHLRAGRAQLGRIAAADYRDAGEPFDKVFAINVNAFWRGPAAELLVIRDVLAPGGRLHLVYEPPSAAQLYRIAEACRASLEAAGFVVLETRRRRSPKPMVGIVAGIR